MDTSRDLAETIPDPGPDRSTDRGGSFGGAAGQSSPEAGAWPTQAEPPGAERTVEGPPAADAPASPADTGRTTEWVPDPGPTSRSGSPLDPGPELAQTLAVTGMGRPSSASVGLGKTVEAPTQSGQDARPGGAASRYPTVPSYRILGELGRGGMGVVYRAEHLVLNRVVALKVILAGSHAGPEQAARFLSEAQAVAQLHHPDIVQIYEIGETEGLPYFSLEYVDGGSLEQRVDGQPQNPREAARLTEVLARAMHAAHRAGIVHRDLKPANVLMTADGRPKITDFGLAKRLEADSSQTRTGTIMGTPGYMAPEQAWGKTHEVGPHSDIYSLGAILYDLLTGRPPFQGTSVLGTLEQVRSREPVAPSQLQPKVPGDLETICLKCLSKEPAGRYATAVELADDLRRFLDDEPILARRVSSIERARRWCRRNPRVAGLLAAVAVLLVAVVAILATATVMLRESNRELRQTWNRERAAKLLAQTKQKEAEESALRAVEQNKKALDAWRNFAQISYGRLREVPGAEGVRLELLDQARQGVQSTIEGMEPLYRVTRNVANPTLADHAMAGIHKQVGDALLELGEVSEAVEQFERMDRLYEQLARDNPGDSHYRMTLAMGKVALGVVQLNHLGAAADAEHNFRQALDLRRDWMAEQPDNDAARLAVANALGLVATADLRLGRPDEALALYQEELDVREALSEGVRRDYEVRRELSGLHEKLGEVLAALGQPERSRAAFDQCFAIREALYQENPDHIPNTRDVARSYNNTGHRDLLELGDPAAARDAYQKALSGFERIAALSEDNVIFQADVARACYYLATACLRLGEAERAEGLYERCLEIRRSLATDPKAKLSQIDLMVALARCGAHREAAEIAYRMIETTPRDARIYVETACGLALCAGAAEREGADPGLAARYADEAFQAIRDGLNAGWRDVGRLEVDPDLDPIRDHPGFRQLLLDLAFPNPAFARDAAAS